MRAISEGDLTKTIDKDYQGAYGEQQTMSFFRTASKSTHLTAAQTRKPTLGKDQPRKVPVAPVMGNLALSGNEPDASQFAKFT